ncbi:VOC family protein [Kurthia sibirica]|uniref:Glyoxalase n=1 Tax=Kurthia sibirica TaxID=202750 RepID=A0A2U3APC9_9BACL|nr:VOC family protein [Kurthia sibirica]PWI26408.1 glyoxalase [Kurthia sibirica]GEK34154.1 catechol-2,3-dioxygenase [Kurthia sibirica]
MTNTFHAKPNLYVSHVQLKVSNLQTSVTYYTNVIGFQILQQTATTAYLTFDGKTSLISLVEVANAQPFEGHTGLYHFALLLPTRKDLGNIVQHFIKDTIRIGAGDHDVSEALYLNDPDGNGIEIYADRPASQWKWDDNNQVYMTTETVDFESVLAEADGTWNGLPEGTVMGHIHLSVNNLVATEKFYTTVLDYNVVTRYGAQALFISTGNYHHHIGLNTWNSQGGTPLPTNAIGLKSYTIVLKDSDYAMHVQESLTAAGFVVDKFLEAPEFGGTQAFSVLDPNGIRIIFTTEGQ